MKSPASCVEVRLQKTVWTTLSYVQTLMISIAWPSKMDKCYCLSSPNSLLTSVLFCCFPTFASTTYLAHGLNLSSTTGWFLQNCCICCWLLKSSTMSCSAVQHAACSVQVGPRNFAFWWYCLQRADHVLHKKQHLPRTIPTHQSGHHNKITAICLLWFALACIDFAVSQRLLNIMLRDKPDIMTCVMAYISNVTWQTAAASSAHNTYTSCDRWHDLCTQQAWT